MSDHTDPRQDPMDEARRAAADLGVDLPPGLVYLGADQTVMIGTANEFRVAVAVLNRIEGVPVEQCWPADPDPDPRPFTEMLADWRDENGNLPHMWMGYELRRQLREALGPEIRGLPRAVALEIADDANDVTRNSTFATLEDLARWTASKDTSVVRDALKRLAAAGWEFRVPIGKGKDGRALYAVPGTRMVFRVPDFEGRVATTPKGESGLPLEVEGRVTTPSEGVTTPSEGVVTTPYSSSPHSSVTTAGKPAVGRQLPQQKQPTKHQVADDLTTAFWEHHGKGRAQPFIAVRGVIRTAIANGVDRDQLARALDQVAREGRAISGATLDIALGSLARPGSQQQRGGARTTIPSHDEFKNGTVTYRV